MKVAIFSTKFYEPEYLDRFNQERHQLTYFNVALNAESAHLASGFDAASIVTQDSIDSTAIDALEKFGIKLIALRCAGYDNVDLAAAAHRIAIVRIPAYSPQAIAEHAVALILALSRKIHKVYNHVKENDFSLTGLMGFNLHKKTVGVIGTGKIGSAFCNIMLGFGCNVVAVDPEESEDLKQKGIPYMPFEQLLQRSDIVSIHCPLTPQTFHLFNSSTFSKMKKGAMLINTGRGGVIKTEDAIDALKNERLGFLGIDVYEREAALFPRDLSNSIVQDDSFAILKSFNNVLITPHQAYFTEEAVEQIAAMTIQNFTDFESGSELTNEIRL